jgi:hypothetical protein
MGATVSLTPKNWNSFQHYKDRAPIWIKLHRSLLDDADFHCLPVDSRALAPMLWLLASEYEGGSITAEPRKIAWRLRMSPDELSKALKPLIDGGFFVDSDPLAACKRDAMPEKEKETETETETETDIRSTSRPARAPSRFDEFWKAYPRREGPNPRKPAEQRFDALVKTGLDPEFLIGEVRKFAALDDTRKAIGTRFIPQASTWLNQQRWSDHAAVAALAEGLAPEVQIEEAVKMFARFGHWSRWAGAEPGAIGCKASADLLAKYGLGPDGRKLQPSSEAA